MILLLRVSEADEVPISSHIWVALMTFKQLYNLEKKSKFIFMTIFGLVESFKKTNRPGPRTTPLDGLFMGKYTR